MMKSLLIFCGVMLFTFSLQAQKKTNKIQPPPRVKVPAPPKLEPSPQETKLLEANPLEDSDIAFKTDPVYLKTDTAFIVQEKYFTPGGYRSARISVESKIYPVNFTQDSLVVEEGRISLPIESVVQYIDGKYVYDGKYPKQSKKLIFTDDKENKKITFNIIWDTQNQSTKGKSIKALVNAETKENWNASEPLPIYPSL